MTASYLFIDLETRSTVDLRKTGAHVYFESETTDLWCACWALDDGPVSTWRPGMPCPPAVAAHIRAGGMVSGWNVGFEYLGFRHLLGPKYGWPTPAMEQLDDTAALAAAMALPRDLGGASVALGLDVQKDMEGKALMLRMSRPRRDSPLTWWDEPEKIARLEAYCVVDVETERAARKRLVPLSTDERAMWLLDAKINARGIRLDIPLAKAMIHIVDEETARLNHEMTEATDGAVTAASQVSALASWLRTNGVPAESLAKAALSELLDLEDVPPSCRRALNIRKEAAKASTAKLKTAVACTGRDGRARGLVLYHGAGTGRWSGKLFQPHNLPRGSGVVKDPERATPWMMMRNAELISQLYGAPMSAVSDCLRSVICAEPGRDLVVADFSAIEGRVTAWLAGEESELDAYRLNDAGAGPGIYEIAAAGIFGRDVREIGKKSLERQVGKVACIAEGQLVLTDDGLVPIESVSLAHKLWDGVVWVSHEGVVFKGVRDVYEYGGLTATADHPVFTQEGRCLHFEVAGVLGDPLARSGAGKYPLLCDRKSAEGRSGTYMPKGSRRVYDIVNAGPRHRFTVSGCLVHNCLALGFAGGVNAFYSMAQNYPDVKMEAALTPLWAGADEERREKVVKRYERCLRRQEAGTDKMSREAWLASELTKVGWRAAHPETVKFWADLEDAARAAIAAPGLVSHVSKLSFIVARGFLWMRLPSGRCLAYGAPRTRAQVWVRLIDPVTRQPSDDSEIMFKDQAERLAGEGQLVIERPAKAAVTALGVDAKTRKWGRFALYSGLICENAVQATARDVMAYAMVRSEARGYPIVLTVHDEILAEPPETFGSVAEFEALICEAEPWAAGLPVSASGWRGKRYKKD